MFPTRLVSELFFLVIYAAASRQKECKFVLWRLVVVS